MNRHRLAGVTGRKFRTRLSFPRGIASLFHTLLLVVVFRFPSHAMAQEAALAKQTIRDAVVGGGAGAIIAEEMDRQAKELGRGLTKAKVERIDEGLLVTLSTDLLFDSGSAALQSGAISLLNELARSLEAYENSSVLIVAPGGGGGDAATTLSQRRADAIKSHLASRGIGRSRLTSRGLAAAAPGSDASLPPIEIALYASEAWKEEAKAEAPGAPTVVGVAGTGAATPTPETPDASGTGTGAAEEPPSAPTPAALDSAAAEEAPDEAKSSSEEEEEPFVRPSLRAGVLSGAFTLDGRLDDPAWHADRDSIADLTTVIPEEGEEPEQETMVKVLANSQEIVIGVRCYDEEPSKIISFSKERDAELAEEDNVVVVFDTFMDGRSGYVFSVNPAGARFDGLVAAQGDEVNSNWDAIWEAKTSRDEGGWSAEIRIPIRSLGYKAGLTSWGFNIERRVERLRETSRWSGANQDYEIFQTSRSGMLNDLPRFDFGVGLSIRPATVANISKASKAEESIFDGDVSLDMTQRLGPNLLSALTVNTDFAETEVDVRQINLTRFPVLFPEKRTFFLQGADIFEFATGLDEDLVPFFSRRIGLLGQDEDLTPVPINVGAKLDGRIGNTNVAGLAVNTNDQDQLLIEDFPANVPQTTMGAFRVKQNILAESSIGAIGTFGEQAGRWDAWTAGVDLLLKTSSFRGEKNLEFALWGLANDRKDLEGGKTAYGFELAYPNDLLDVAIALINIGTAFDPSLGFVPRNGVRLWKIGGQFNPRPPSKSVHQILTELSLDVFESLHTKKWETYVLTFTPVDWLLETGDRITLSIEPQGDRPTKSFEVTNDVDLPRGSYEFTRFTLGARAAENRKVSGEIIWESGSYYNGDLQTVEGRLTLKPSSLLLFEFNRERNWGTVRALENIEESQGATRTEKRDFQENLLGMRLGVNFSPDLQFSSLTQYETESRELGSNNRLRWTFRPQGDVYLVYNHNLNRTVSDKWTFGSNQSLFKIQYAWRF